MKESEWRAPVAQLDRASGYGPEGCRFDSYRVHHFMSGGVAQLVEQRTENPCVTGSRPVLATIFLPLCRTDTPFGFFIFQICALIFNDLRNQRKTEILRSPPFPMQIL